jgi:UDPglucose 6-dehydrogenase
MKIAVIGTGYVGLVTATCLAESGNDVIGIDKDVQKIQVLESGRLPIHEPGLLELMQRNRREGRLVFTTNLAQGIRDAAVIFIAVGTPQAHDGSADVSSIEAVVDQIADCAIGPKIIVIKSTVPVGTNKAMAGRLAARGKRQLEMASNPEFLKEGAALDDFMRPDRVVVGVRRPEVANVLHEMYAPFLRTERPFLVMSPESAEMTKYTANAMLSVKISFINEVANLCELLDCDINDVRRGIGHDARIGFHFLFPGAGYGGSCFPKDVRALSTLARRHGMPLQLMDAVDRINEKQKQVLVKKVRDHYGNGLRGKTLAIWGLAFKPRTDDIREAPALALIDALLEDGVSLRVHDPEAITNVRARYGTKLTYCDRPYDTLQGADGVAIVTEWQEFRNPNFTMMASLLREPVVFDGRNLYDPAQMAEAGFIYYSIGRQTVVPQAQEKRSAA